VGARCCSWVVVGFVVVRGWALVAVRGLWSWALVAVLGIVVVGGRSSSWVGARRRSWVVVMGARRCSGDRGSGRWRWFEGGRCGSSSSFVGGDCGRWRLFCDRGWSSSLVGSEWWRGFGWLFMGGGRSSCVRSRALGVIRGWWCLVFVGGQ
jgi:hypothetical protein